jgi:hypothetical protein
MCLPRRPGGDLSTTSLDAGKYFSLNSVEKRIWEIPEYPAQPATTVRQLAAEYDAPVETCAMQVGDFLKKLRGRGLPADADGVVSLSHGGQHMGSRHCG